MNRRRRTRWLLPIALLCCLTSFAVVSSGASGEVDKRKCGVLPGEGFYNYVKVRNVSCSQARKVGYKAGREFCSGDRCNSDPLDPPVRGHVKTRGWACKMKVGYESFQTRCRRGDASFLLRSGA